MCIKANYELTEDVFKKLIDSESFETSPLARNILQKLILNAEIAKTEKMPICQDTGIAVFFIEIGQDVHIDGGNLEDAINEGVRQGYKEGYLRKSVVNDPILRKNTDDNTPAIIHYNIVKGDKFKIYFSPKGFGSENMSALKMLKPSDGIEGIKKFVLDVIKNAGGNPCPPIIVGIGIGGTAEKACILAKKSLFRKIGTHNKLKHIEKLENELLQIINETNIGPQGLGGTTTALAVNIEVFPTHIAGLPVAVNLNCNAARHIEVEL